MIGVDITVEHIAVLGIRVDLAVAIGPDHLRVPAIQILANGNLDAIIDDEDFRLIWMIIVIVVIVVVIATVTAVDQVIPVVVSDRAGITVDPAIGRTGVEVDADDLDVTAGLAIVDRVVCKDITGLDVIVTRSADHGVFAITGNNRIIEDSVDR